ncbi:MAG: DUF1015 domain-containing protein [Candidatus Zixiibacteriota bacterium]|nr:MAG: DUF1015 domain-containing protein [candidate division Zixibacteria bacterium]
MSVVRPFRGLRPKPEFAGEVASPPYDVLSSDEARALVKENPNSFLRVNKSEVDFPPDTPVYSDAVYKKGKENLSRLINDGIMIRDEQSCFYLYRLTWQERSQTGLVALASVDEYDRGLIKKHEHTRPEKVSDRANHIMSLEAQVGPVFVTFKHNRQIKTLVADLTATAPEVDFTSDDGVRHQLWVVDAGGSIAAIGEAFAVLNEMYIADGHHRSQSASEVCRRMREKNPGHTGEEPYNFFLTVIFPDDELRILPYNRVVKDLNGLTPQEVLSRAAGSFSVTPRNEAVIPQENHHIGVYVDGRWHELAVKSGTFDPGDPAESIDSAILTKNFLAPVLGISDIRTDKRIDFVGGIRGVSELTRLVDSSQYRIAYSMYPVTVNQLLQVADAGKVMPPKSTWFEPKLRSGMVVNVLRD